MKNKLKKENYMKNNISKQKKWENDIFLSSLGIYIDASNITPLEGLTISDWNNIIQKASNHKVAPMIYYRFGKDGITEYIPNEILLKLRKIYLAVLSKNMRIYKELSKLLKELNNENIPVIILKGAALAEMVYETIALRPMEDVDLIVKGENIQKLNRILLGSGWENEEYLNPMGTHEKYSKHINYTNRIINIEIHPKLYELPRLDPWANAVGVKIASTDTFILGLEDFLMHLCLHLDDHYRTGLAFNLIWYLDIAKFIEHYKDDINWDYIIETSKKHKVEGSMHRVLQAINEGFGGYVTLDTLNQLKNDQYDLHITDALDSVSNPIRHFYSLLSEVFAPRILPIRNRVYMTFRNIFPCKAYMMHRYPIKHKRSLHLYYFLRIIIGIGKFLKGLYHLPVYIKERNERRHHNVTGDF